MSQAAATTGARQGSMARDIAMIAVFAALTAALGLVPAIDLGFLPAPITAQSLGVMLAGSILGARRGGLSQLLLLVLVALGLPLLAGGRGGLGVFFGMSWGFLVGWVVCAWAIGLMSERAGRYTVAKGLVINVLGGIVLLYACGIVGFMAKGHMSLGKALALNANYLVGDAVKVVIAALVADGVHRAYPGLLTGRR